jgi:hypothetical protein
VAETVLSHFKLTSIRIAPKPLPRTPFAVPRNHGQIGLHSVPDEKIQDRLCPSPALGQALCVELHRGKTVGVTRKTDVVEPEENVMSPFPPSISTRWAAKPFASTCPSARQALHPRVGSGSPAQNMPFSSLPSSARDLARRRDPVVPLPQ